MAFSLANRSSASSNASISYALTPTFTQPTSGNVLFCFVTGDKNVGAFNAVTGWTLVYQSEGSGVSQALYFKVSDGTETSLYITWSDLAWVSAFVEEWTGFTGTPTIDVYTNANSGATAVGSMSTGTTGTTSYNSALAIASLGVDSGMPVSPTLSNSFTLGYYFDRSPSGGYEVVASAYKELSSTQTVETTFSFSSGSDQMAAGIVVIGDSEDTYSLQMICDGDSHTSATYGLWPEQIVENSLGDWTYQKFGRVGYTTTQVLADWSSRAGAVSLIEDIPNVYVCWCGINDVDADETANDIVSRILTIVSNAKTKGYSHIVVVDLLTYSSITGAQETVRTSVNSLLETYEASSDYFLAKVSDITVLTNPSDTTYFLGDGVHLTATGYALVSASITNTLRIKTRVAGGIYSTDTLQNLFADYHVLSNCIAPVSTNVIGMAIRTVVDGNVKVNVYSDDSGSPDALLASNDSGAAVSSGQYTLIPFSSAFEITKNDELWGGTNGSIDGAIAYVNDGIGEWIYKTSTYSTFTAPDPAGTGWSAPAGNTILTYLYGISNPIIDSSSSSTIAADDSVLFSVRGALDDIGSGKLELCNNSSYASATIKVEQTIDSWDNFNISTTIVEGTLSPGTVYAFVTTDLGQINDTGYSVTLTGAAPTTSGVKPFFFGSNF